MEKAVHLAHGKQFSGEKEVIGKRGWQGSVINNIRSCEGETFFSD